MLKTVNVSKIYVNKSDSINKVRTVIRKTDNS